LPIDPELRELLSQLIGSLNDVGQGKTASVLISEVRDALRDSGSPTVASSIRNLQISISEQFNNLIQSLRSGGGIAGGSSSTRDGLPGTHNDMISILEEIKEQGEKVGILLGELVENFSHRENGTEGVTSGFEFRALTQRYKSVDEVLQQLNSSALSLRDKFLLITNDFSLRQESSALRAQYIAQQKYAILTMVNMTTKALDLVNVFEKLGHFISKMVSEGYELFQRTRSIGLTGAQTLLDDFQRVYEHGISGAGFSNRLTAEQIMQYSGAGGTPTMLAIGRNIGQMSQVLGQALQQMQQQGRNPLNILSPNDFIKFFQDQISFMKQARILSTMNTDTQTQIMLRGLTFFSEISRYTGISADKLSEMAKKNDERINELQALGMVSQQEREIVRNNLTALQSMGPGGAGISNLLLEYLKSGRNMGMFLGSNPDVVIANSVTRGLIPAIEQLSNLLFKQTSGPEFMRQAATIINQVQLAQGSTGAIAGIIRSYPGITKILGDVQALGGYSPETMQKFQMPAETDALKNMATMLEQFRSQFPIFARAVETFYNGVLTFVGALAAYGVASRVLGFGAGAGGGGGAIAGRLLGGAGRLAGPVLGGVGGAVTAYAEGAPTAGVIGGGVGGAGGAFLGAQIGGMLGSFAPVIGNAIGAAAGAVIGGFIGSWGGQKLGTAISSPTNMVGPGNNTISGYNIEDQQNTGLLAQIAQGGNSTVALLSQISTELAQQTALIRGSGVGSKGLPGYQNQGLTSSSLPVARTGRPDSSTPYDGSGG
jgi:hypothetical protein